MARIKSIVRPVVKEFKISNCGFDHLPPDDFVKSQWQTRTKSFLFMLYRCLLAGFYLGVVIYSMALDFSDGLYFIYLTHWGILLCMATTMLGAILVCTWYAHPEYADRVKDSNKMPLAFRIYWAMHVIALILSICITITYWTVLYNDMTITASNILTHAFNSVIMFIDLWIVAYPVRLLHIFLPIAFGLVYSIFSVIYYAVGGVDPFGNPYIYPILDWADPGKAIANTVGVMLLCCALYVFIFIVYKLRVFIHKRYNKKVLFEPTQDPTQVNATTPVTLPSNRISMVLGDYGHDNLSFAKSSEKIVS